MSSLNETPSGERVHIGFFGIRNAGKSSLVNKITGQNLSVVSEIKGTTTDPVKKAMELLPLGPVLIIDTPGFDDDSEILGELRVKKTREILAQCDIAVLVVNSINPENDFNVNFNQDLINLFNERNIPYIIAHNKADLLLEVPEPERENEIYVSALNGLNIENLKIKIAALAKSKAVNDKRLIADLLEPNDIVVLVIPIDESAPKGRLILPQQQVIRDILDAHCIALTCQPEELKDILKFIKPKIVVTDSQAFKRVDQDTPSDIYLTSFSILFARYKGDLKTLVRGANKLSSLKPGDKVLISEGCTHHRQCGDIGTVKIPALIKKFTKAVPEFKFTSGGEFPDLDELKNYDLIIHCGGCMLNDREMANRINKACEAGVEIVNYGVAIACMNGILKRSLIKF
ncbi:MAG: [Synergistaceae bacterium]|nr:[FeFe] hydrogenase H-cluster maturation GTPase HydF [Synergistaceae bacterium]MBR0221673.1 [FeFe] hydrogenase H-cluster maturation GTPase HydF [Synergistaceae bacterium]